MNVSERRNKSALVPDAGLSVLCAFGLDLLGEPPAQWHPVVWYGRLISEPGGARACRGVRGAVLLWSRDVDCSIPTCFATELFDQTRSGASQQPETA